MCITNHELVISYNIASLGHQFPMTATIYKRLSHFPNKPALLHQVRTHIHILVSTDSREEMLHLEVFFLYILLLKIILLKP